MTLFRPLFDDVRYKIDMSPLPSSTRQVFNVKKFLKIIGASLTTNFTVDCIVFSIASAGVYFEVFLIFFKGLAS